MIDTPFPSSRTRSGISLLLLSSILLMASPAQADIRATERALDGPRAPVVDRGPRHVPSFAGAVIIRFAPPSEVRAACPRTIDRHALGCTDPVRRIVTMPDETTSGLSTDRWLALLRHEILHAQGLDWHGPR